MLGCHWHGVFILDIASLLLLGLGLISNCSLVVQKIWLHKGNSDTYLTPTLLYKC